MQLYLVYSGTQEDEDGVRGIYDSYDKAVDNVRKLVEYGTNYRPVVTNYLCRFENGYSHIYIDEETLNAPVL
jgi:hypothetical protein